MALIGQKVNWKLLRNNLRERQQIKLNGDSTGVSSENFRENVIQGRSVSKAEETQRNLIQKSTMKGK